MLRPFFKRKAQEPGETKSSALQISYVLKHQEILYQKEKHVCKIQSKIQPSW